MKPKRNRIRVRKIEHVLSTKLSEEEKKNDNNLYICATKNIFDEKINKYGNNRQVS